MLTIRVAKLCGLLSAMWSGIFVNTYVNETYLSSRICDKFCRMQVVRIGASGTGVTISAWTGAQWLCEVETYVHCVTHLKHSVVTGKLYIYIVIGGTFR